jgi:predicted nucleotidyltransferase
MQHFSQLLERLADAGLEFVVVGGFAAVTHGAVYVTRDVDICAVLTPENVARLRAALADWNPRHRMTPQKVSFLQHPPAGEPLQNLYLQTDMGVVDILTSVLGVGDFQRLNAKAEVLEVDGRKFRIMSLEDLITAKDAMGRDKDKLIAKELRVIQLNRRLGRQGG